MSFNSVIFIFFFLPTVLIGNFLLQKKPKWKKIWLAIAGLVFYGYCNLRILAFLVLYGLVHYWIGCLLESCNDRKIARNYLLMYWSFPIDFDYVDKIRPKYLVLECVERYIPQAMEGNAAVLNWNLE